MVTFSAVTYEVLPWASRIPDDLISRRQAERMPTTYRAAIPAPIAQVEFTLPSDLATAAEDATRVISRLDDYATQAFGGRAVAPLTSVLLRSESASSSQIENLTVSARQLAVAELGLAASGNAELVVGNVAAMVAAIDLADNLGESAILAMHATLLASRPQANPGAWRDVPVWIGPSGLSPANAVFVPPAAARVPACMADLVAFLARTDLPAMVHAAVAHAQFETIHPFIDGNGRTGRALMQAMLRASGVIRHGTVPVSAGLLSNLDAYTAALTAFRDGDFAPIVECLAEASTKAVVLGHWLVDELGALVGKRMDEARPRAGSAFESLIYYLVGQPAVTMASVAKSLGVSTAAASRAVNQAVDAGMLKPTSDKQRNRVWLDQQVIGVLNEFAARAGRRA